MAGEGEYPKIDGDITYGSEVTKLWRKDDAYGLTPVAASWNTTPTSLGNITDSDNTTVTGDAVNSVENNTCYVTIDLGDTGKIRRVIGTKYDFATSDPVANSKLFFEIYDGSSWLDVESLTGVTFNTYEDLTVNASALLPPDQIVEQVRFKCENAGNKTLTIAFYSIVVW